MKIVKDKLSGKRSKLVIKKVSCKDCPYSVDNECKLDQCFYASTRQNKLTNKAEVRMKVSKAISVTEWASECPYCKQGRAFFEGGYVNSCDFANKPIIVTCEDCNKEFEVIIETNKIQKGG